MMYPARLTRWGAGLCALWPLILLAGDPAPDLASDSMPDAPPAWPAQTWSVESAELQQPGFDQPPEMPAVAAPAYPPELERSGNEGKVLAGVEIGAEGRVQSITILRSSHPRLEEVVVDFLLPLRFKPAQLAGKAVPSRVKVPFTFDIEHMEGRAPFTVGGDGMAGGGPDRVVLDVVTAAVYPFEQALQDRAGSATVKALVDASGRVRRTAIVEASEPAFGEATAAMLESWRFRARPAGSPPVALVRTQPFGQGARDGELSPQALALIQRLHKPMPGLAQLDRAPRVTYSVEPVWPTALQATELTGGHALLEFHLDETGHVQLPRVVSATHAAFGWSAATALLRWRFEPATVAGQPTVARLRLPFTFKRAAPRPAPQPRDQGTPGP